MTKTHEKHYVRTDGKMRTLDQFLVSNSRMSGENEKVRRDVERREESVDLPARSSMEMEGKHKENEIPNQSSISRESIASQGSIKTQKKFVDVQLSSILQLRNQVSSQISSGMLSSFHNL